jgi:N-methylhydantoinase A
MLAGESLSPQRLAREREQLVAEAVEALAIPASRIRVRYELRYRGQSFELPVDDEISAGSGGFDPAQLRDAFARAHELRYGYRDDASAVELVNMRASAWGPAPNLRPLAASDSSALTGELRPVVFTGETLDAAVLRGQPAPGATITGPSVCALPEATLLVPPGWAGGVDDHGTIHLRREQG